MVIREDLRMPSYAMTAEDCRQGSEKHRGCESACKVYSLLFGEYLRDVGILGLYIDDVDLERYRGIGKQQVLWELIYHIALQCRGKKPAIIRLLGYGAYMSGYLDKYYPWLS